MFLRLWPTEKLIYIPIEADQINAATTNAKHSSSSTGKTSSMMTLSPKSLAGPGYIILNGIRAMNVIGLLAVVTASILMLVKTTSKSHFFFFDAVSHVLTGITGMFLFVSELSLFQPYFARNWPLLGPSHGFVTLALAMIVLGINMLANLNKSATSQTSLGLPFWRIVIASGIVIFILGFANLIASYIFRDRKQGITARQLRAHGAVAIHQTPMPGTGTPPAPELAQQYIPSPITPTKTSSPFHLFTSERRQSTLPSYHSHSQASSPIKEPLSPSSKYSRATDCSKKVFSFINRNRQSVGPKLPVNTREREMEISAPMGVNPQFAHLVQRPDSAMHPSRTGDSEAYRWRAVS
ncbi:hypothetical protein LTR53_009038 [Teratosphaeriaceae sp. CCFEE 6253]|nr:hypothetical protein LTR53_009038 [Teratosphaeriaceae sp. CCFEE 6253]